MKKKILVIITGSIAAFKACSVVSKLKQKGYELEVVLSRSAIEFLGPSTIEGLTGKKPHVSMYEPGEVMEHIHLARWADLILVAPATAHFINSAASGIGDSFPTTLFLAHDFKKPFLVAPAMNTMMYLHPATQASLQKLKHFGVEILETASGVLACGETGWGRLLEPDLIVAEIEKYFDASRSVLPQDKSLMKNVIVTAGGTMEPLDSVRALTNFSTGQTGAQIASSLAQFGFHVQLFLSENHRVSLPTIERVDNLKLNFFRTAEDLRSLLKRHLQESPIDAVVHAAAVSDFTITEVTRADGTKASFTGGKINSGEELVVKLRPQAKLINEIKSMSSNKDLLLVGFKLTDHANADEIEAKVKALFSTGQCDVVVHNDCQDRTTTSHKFSIHKKNQRSFTTCTSAVELGSVLNTVFQKGGLS